uniref:Uncharacterized protein n=1 Tax=Tanacetum cinerariifolium TaxID=118510 RepID=A0A699KBN6_TANCI|nr:hypothetical protein [Tanacetum cinerariifolium]
MATIIDQQAFLVTADVPEIYMQEFWATTKLYQHSIRFKLDTRKSVLDLEAFREMLHISPRIPSQSFVELPFEEEILDFLRFLEHSDEIRHLTDTTQQYGAILPIELTTDDIRNSKAYKEYYACATGVAAPKLKASARKKKGNSASSTTPPTPTPPTTVVAAPRLSATAKGVSDVPSDDSEEELSWNSSDDEDVDEQTKGREESEGDKDDDNDDEDTESGKGGDEVSESEGESDEEEQDNKKRKVLIQFPKLLKEVRMKAVMRRIKN